MIELYVDGSAQLGSEVMDAYGGWGLYVPTANFTANDGVKGPEVNAYRMELMGILAALQYVNKQTIPNEYLIICDNDVAVSVVKGTKSAKRHTDVMSQIRAEIRKAKDNRNKVSLQWQAGKGDYNRDKVDQLAKAGARSVRPRPRREGAISEL